MVITPPWRKLVVVVGLTTAIGLAGCSGGPSSSGVASINGSGSTSTPSAAGAGSGGNSQSDAAEQDAMVKFAQCMRQHGVDMPDPKPAAGGGGGAVEAMPGVKANDPAAMQQMQAASTACQKLLPNGGKPTQQDLQRQLKFAQCMRAHGVDIPDPNPNGGGNRMTIDANDPKTKAAFSACMPTGTGTTSGK
jgi:hypothetical protein